MTAFVFPGQGAQYVGMGKDFAQTFLKAKEIFQEADDILGEHLSKIIFEGPIDLLTQTKNSQPAIFVNSMAILRVIQTQMPDLVPSMAAGLSLGEYTALCATGRLPFRETLLLIRKRAEFMNRAAEEKKGTMAAVLSSLSAKEIEQIIQGCEGVWVANYNCPGQIVISGTEKGVALATEKLKASGAKRVIPLTVHGAFHSALMQSAQDSLAPFIQKISLSPSKVRFAMNVPGDFVTSEEEIRQFLLSQVTQSVRWEQTIQAMEKKQPSLYVEIGCGKTLSGLIKKTGVLASIHSVDCISDLDRAELKRREYAKTDSSDCFGIDKIGNSCTC